MANKLAKETFLNQLFTTKTVRGENGKLADTRLEVTNEELNTHFNKLYKKYADLYEYDKSAFMTDAIFFTNEAVQSFELKDGNTWEGILDGSDKVSIDKLLGSIKKYVKHGIPKLHFRGFTTTRAVTHEDGTKERVQAIVTIKMDSTDRLMQTSEEDNGCERQLDSATNFWGVTDSTKTVFAQWFDENKGRILTASQMELLDKLNEVQYFQAKEVLTSAELSAELGGMNPEHVNIKLGRIASRIAKKWEKERNVSDKTFLEARLENSINVLETGLELFDDGMHETFSDFVKENIDSVSFENVVDELERVDNLAINASLKNDTPIPHNTLHRVAELMVAELEVLKVELENERVAKQSLVKQTHVVKEKTYTPAQCGKTIYLYVDANGNLLQEK